jgi:hypothetical protein
LLSGSIASGGSPQQVEFRFGLIRRSLAEASSLSLDWQKIDSTKGGDECGG